MALILYMFLMVAMIFLLIAYGFDMFRFENGLFSTGMYFKWSAMYWLAMPTFLVVGWVPSIINFCRAKKSLRATEELEPEPDTLVRSRFAPVRSRFAPPRTASGAEAMKTAVRHTLVPLWPCCRRGAWMRVTRYDRS